MCGHSLQHGRGRGLRAMKFNFLVSTKERAVRLWQSLGFAIVTDRRERSTIHGTGL